MNVLTMLDFIDLLISKKDIPALSALFAERIAKLWEIRFLTVYQRTASGDALVPMPGPNPNEISLDELDNPIVYSFVSGQSCRINDISSLIDVGAGFETLRPQLADGLLTQPLLDSKAAALGVMLLSAEKERLDALCADPIWSRLFKLYLRLFEFLHEQRHAEMNARYRSESQAKALELGKAHSARLLAADFIGVSPAAKQIRNDMLMMAESALSVLITGETGAGKDHAAWLIHQMSSRSDKAFIPINCAAIPKDLIEAELFGSVKGAYTGSTQARNGLVAAAHGGTLFLDEIGDMPLTLQGTLLRLLNEKKYRPLGSTREQASDFRLICATHQPLQQLVEKGQFRQDLYFRIRQLTLHIPPLRERSEDIAALSRHLVRQFNGERGTNITGLTQAALDKLEKHDFTGNIRELRNLLLVACERTPSGLPIDADVLRLTERSAVIERQTGPLERGMDTLLRTNNLPEAVEAFEQLIINTRLGETQGSRARAAESLGIPKRTLARKCQKWSLEGIHDR